jgi:hypothetical protein
LPESERGDLKQEGRMRASGTDGISGQVGPDPAHPRYCLEQLESQCQFQHLQERDGVCRDIEKGVGWPPFPLYYPPQPILAQDFLEDVQSPDAGAPTGLGSR